MAAGADHLALTVLLSNVLSLGMLTLVLFFGASGLAYLIKKSFSLTLPLFCMALILIMYGFALSGYLEYGFYVVATLSLVLGCLAIYGLTVATDRHEYRSHIFNYGLLAFCLFALMTLVLNFGREVTRTDDYNYWALSVRQMMLYKDLVARHPESVAFGLVKPPATSLFQFFFMRLDGVYSEFSLFASLQMLTYAFLLPLFDTVKKNPLRFFTLLMFLPGFLMALQFSGQPSPFSTLVIDLLVAVVTGFGLFVITHLDYSIRFKASVLLPLVAILILQKDTGIMLVAILVVAAIAQGFFSRRDPGTRHPAQYIGITVMMVVVAALSLLSWRTVI